MEDDTVAIAKSVTDNYEDEEIKQTFLDVIFALYGVHESMCPVSNG